MKVVRGLSIAEYFEQMQNNFKTIRLRDSYGVAMSKGTTAPKERIAIAYDDGRVKLFDKKYLDEFVEMIVEYEDMADSEVTLTVKFPLSDWQADALG